jgi:hypothetical protein
VLLEKLKVFGQFVNIRLILFRFLLEKFSILDEGFELCLGLDHNLMDLEQLGFNLLQHPENLTLLMPVVIDNLGDMLTDILLGMNPDPTIINLAIYVID